MHDDLPEAIMQVNEWGDPVPPEVAEAAREHGCLDGIKYVYPDGDYGGRYPCASIDCYRATRFRGTNYQDYKVPLGAGWVAFRSPSGPTVLPPQPGDESSDVADVLALLASAQYRPDEDDWLPQAKKLVEQSIDQLSQEFREFPYLHRVEHSIHCQLFHIMMSHEELAQRVPLGNDRAETQLIHKEWPESTAREGRRRGNFDLAVLPPRLLKECPTIAEFREGRLEAPIVIEMGLDYDAEHLVGDIKKLINSKPKHGYLIHLVREKPRDTVSEQMLLGIQAKYGIKSAYVWMAGGQSVFKRVNDPTITIHQDEP
jgi:hypothetical protein